MAKNLHTDYYGYKAVKDDDPYLSDLYGDKTINWYDLLENQYLVVTDQDGNDVDVMKWQDGKYRPIYKKAVESIALGKIKPKNCQQKCAVDALLDDKTTVKVLTGSFGSGKTLLTCVCAFQRLQEGSFDKIVWIRNPIGVKDVTEVGYLKGDLQTKLLPFVMPLSDHVGGPEALELFIQQGKIEVIHLGHIRGRDIRNSIIFCTEAENLTRSQVQLLLGRIAEGSIIVFEGDFKQVDSRTFESDNNGMLAAIECLKGNKLFSYVNLPESVRSETARLADLLDRE